MCDDKARMELAEELAPDTASATECTGLVPALESDDEDAASRRLYAVHPARRQRRRNSR